MMPILVALLAIQQPPAPADTRAAEAHIETRLKAAHGPSFESWAELVAFVKLAAPHASDAAARDRFVLHELRAVSRALETAGRATSRAATAFVAERDAMLVYHEPPGHYIFRNEYLRSLHGRFKGRPIADEIAWFAVENSLPGESEGYTPGVVFRINALDGEYLRRHPRGRHAAESMRRIAEIFDYKGQAPIAMTSWAEECKEMRRDLSRLVASVRASPARGRDAALTALSRVQSVCR